MYKFSMNYVADTKGLDYEKSFCFFLKVWFYVRHIANTYLATVSTVLIVIGTLLKSSILQITGKIR